MTKANILIVEDEVSQGKLIQEILSDQGYIASYLETAEAALELLQVESFDIVISDWRLTGKDGLWLLEEVQKINPNTYFVLATAYGSIQHAVEAVKNGASDYLTKPYSRDQLIFCVERAGEKISLTKENSSLNQELQQRSQLVDMIGNSKPMQKIFHQLQKLAPTDATIHISGESGTGKELAARALHKLSPRCKKSFIVINCGAIPEGLAEAELFGAEKGAYTGAVKTKIGCFEAADGGTLFLDEVAELTLSIQTKLLRVLQDSTLTRVGSQTPLPINVRIISATHKSLKGLVSQNLFREDLLYRLNVIPISMPPLRERTSDLPALITFFNHKHASRHQVPPLKINQRLLETFEGYSWPGNIRELSHTIERLMLLSDDGNINKSDLSFLELSHETKVLTLPQSGINWKQMEHAFYKQALEYANGNKRKAADLLGLSYKTFLYRLEKFLISG
ncbi:sigma-54 dependent transcriptional regulator [Kangiella sp. HZ709]|uniref:sigma-54-dependent transcriptional regulator n=1 Tax=Kangiella sp. HZ709 TaxID=2666328 RepID=UPI0012AFA045|nr:sigma-54 dependent transcriptional regulator [Kangiella sp. HZ709]MRX26754.1 response regulator [Kangiella sp. HZ709]